MIIKKLIILFAIIMTFSCTNQVDEMLEELNESLGYTIIEHHIPQVGDEDFNPQDMLADKYLVSNDATLCLGAPNATSYEWKLQRVIKTEVTFEGYTFFKIDFEPVIITGFQMNTKNINIYIPDAETVLTPGTYRIDLTVADNNNEKYSDFCALIIYDPYYAVEKDSE